MAQPVMQRPLATSRDGTFCATTMPNQPHPFDTVACAAHAQTTPSQPEIRHPLLSPLRYRHIPELTCEINSRDLRIPCFMSAFVSEQEGVQEVGI